MRPLSVAVLLVPLGVVSVAGVARAEAPARRGPTSAEAPDAGEDAETLARAIETSFARLGDQLATHACDEACRALASMRRAADRICDLEPGERCAGARARCEDASRRVREACPECALASLQGPKDQPAAQREPQAAPESVRSEPTRGCASCSATDGSAALLETSTLGALTALAMGALRRRRRGGGRG